MISGQIFVRETAAKAKDGRKLIIVVGILAVPDNTPVHGECQYTVTGSETWTDLTIHPGHKDISEHSKGNDISGLLTLPLWQV